MKHLILFLIIIFAWNSRAQLNYTFASSSVAFNANATPTVIHGTSSNELLSAPISIGFTFTYNCIPYTTFQASTEGWIGLGSGHSLVNSEVNNLSGVPERPKIAPLWDDIRVNSAGSVNYRLTGTAPNRILTVEWLQMRWNDGAGGGGGNVMSFQARLFETTNVIQFNYFQGPTAVNSGSASIGLAGLSLGEFLSVNSAGTAVSSVTETNTINAKPATNARYTFTPTGVTCTGTPVAGTLSASTTTTSCASSTVTFSVAGGSTDCGVTFQWQYSPDNITFTNLAGATSIGLTADILTTGYYRRVSTCVGSGLSANSNAVLITNTDSAPVNDYPCQGIDLVLGVPSSGNNTCSSNSFEPPRPTCWTTGNVNTVWYKFVAPASGQVKIKTIIQATLTVLQRTQIALFSGTCGSLTQLACNQNAPTCGGYIPQNSQIDYTGLTPGATYYIAVDGKNNEVGDFSILVIDGTGNFPNVVGQDCPITFSVCNPTTTIGNPGYQAIGGACDHFTGNCTNGEANSIWYTISINPLLVGSTQLTFDIVPNDFGNPNPITGLPNPGYTGVGAETDYDFVLWKVAGTGATNCAGILGGATPAACNFDALGVTGCSTSGNAPAAYAGFNNAYEVGPTVVANDIFVLVIQNFSNSTAGFSLDIPLLSPVVYTPPTTVYWTGGDFSSSYTATDNWGGCNAPTCGISAFVTASSANQPVLTPGTHSVQDLTINSGAVFTLQTGATLQVCGNLTNNGTLVCQPGSTIEFIGTGVQTITGSFENSDAFFNFTVNKITGSVVLANNIDVDGNFLTSNNTSILNTAGFRVRVGGNFTNANGNSTFSNTGTTGTLGFIGSGAVTYNQGSSQLDLNFVTMNKSAGSTVSLTTNLFIKSGTGTLTLTDGKFITGANRVDVANSAPTAVNAGNANSYVAGNLYRALNSLGSYDFPIGTNALYERANVNFTAATSISTLRARFDPWPSGPNTLGLTNCSGNFILPSQDMGYWTLVASNAPTTGTYNITLYSTGATNTAGATGWTVQKASTIASAWGLNGTCALSTVSVIQRTGLSGFSVFGVAQSTTPLPIELMDFSGYRYNQVNVLKWTTVSELNSDYFLVEKSRNGLDFEVIEKIQALGNSYNPFDYSATDSKPFVGITYYRLNFFDLDGTNEYSKTIAVSDDVSKELKVSSIFPNPGTTELNISYSVSTKSALKIEMMDASGRTLKTAQTEVKGNGTYTVKTDEMGAGLYLVVITNDQGYQETFNWVKK